MHIILQRKAYWAYLTYLGLLGSWAHLDVYQNSINLGVNLTYHPELRLSIFRGWGWCLQVMLQIHSLKIPISFNGGTSDPVNRAQTGSEEPHRNKRKFSLSFLYLTNIVVFIQFLTKERKEAKYTNLWRQLGTLKLINI